MTGIIQHWDTCLSRYHGDPTFAQQHLIQTQLSSTISDAVKRLQNRNNPNSVTSQNAIFAMGSQNMHNFENKKNVIE